MADESSFDEFILETFDAIVAVVPKEGDYHAALRRPFQGLCLCPYHELGMLPPGFFPAEIRLLTIWLWRESSSAASCGG